MPRYTVILTRDVTESAIVSVEASSPEAAAEQALERPASNLTWTVDENIPPEPYATNAELDV